MDVQQLATAARIGAGSRRAWVLVVLALAVLVALIVGAIAALAVWLVPAHALTVSLVATLVGLIALAVPASPLWTGHDVGPAGVTFRFGVLSTITVPATVIREVRVVAVEPGLRNRLGFGFRPQDREELALVRSISAPLVRLYLDPPVPARLLRQRVAVRTVLASVDDAVGLVAIIPVNDRRATPRDQPPI